MSKIDIVDLAIGPLASKREMVDKSKDGHARTTVDMDESTSQSGKPTGDEAVHSVTSDNQTRA